MDTVGCAVLEHLGCGCSLDILIQRDGESPVLLSGICQCMDTVGCAVLKHLGCGCSTDILNQRDGKYLVFLTCI